MSHVVCLMGPTASGKTEIAMRLSESLPVDLVSVDSALVYRFMDIGTAKPTADELQQYPHRLIDICDPEDHYSAGRFVADVQHEIDEILARGRIPFLVGGTMMYFRALIAGIAPLPEANPATRAAIDKEAAVIGWPALHAQLAEIDAHAAAKINPNDAQRIQRALEVYRLSGQNISALQAATAASVYGFLKIALIPEPRAELHRRIENRLDQMLENNFIDEVKKLMERPELTGKHSSMRAVGYRQFWAYLEGQGSFEEARLKALAATRQLAKRQLTWLRSEEDCFFVNPLETDSLDAISKFLGSKLKQCSK